MSYHLTIDIGTHSIKAAVFEQKQDKLVLVAKNLSVFTQKHQNNKDWHTHFLLQLKRSITAVLKNIDSKKQKKDLYITTSGNGPSCFCFDKHNKVISFTSWQDVDSNNRGLWKQGTESYFLPQLQYLKKYNKEVFSKIAFVLPPAEYVGFLLCGKKNIWVPHETYVPYMWSEKDVNTYNMNFIEFAPPLHSSKIVGLANSVFTEEIFSDRFKKIFVVAGGLDYLSALIGANIGENQIFHRGGTSTVLNMIVKKKSFSHPHIDKTLFREKNTHFVLPHFYEDYLNLGIPVQNFNTQYKNAKKISYKKGYPETEVVFGNLKNTYTQLLEIMSITSYKDVYTISGGHASDKIFMQHCAQNLEVNVKCFDLPYCELIGNLAMSLVAAKEKNTIKTALSYIHTQVLHTVYFPYE